MDIELYEGDMLLERAGSPVDIAIQSITTASNIGLIKKRLLSLHTGTREAEDRAESKRLYGLRVRGQKARERLNEQAREILSRINGDPAKLTDADRDILMQYSGRGGLQSENSLSEYYTPPEIAEGTWDLLKANGFENGSVCEPSTGAGVFLGTKPQGVKMVGAEIDPTSSGVAAVLNPDDVVRNQSFEQLCAVTPDGSFDAVIGNVPFGDTRGKWKQYDPDYQDIKEMQRYFVTRAVDKVKPGGLVCLIVPVDIVGKRSKGYAKWRRELALKAEFLGAHKLPSGTFGGQNGNGTDTVVDVLVMRKHSAEVAAKVIDMKAADLEAASVYWEPWLSGQWFASPEGKRFIHGEVMAGFRGDIVKSELTNAQLKQILARKFDSRIDFGLIGTAPTITRNYVDGDRRMIAGIEHELVAGDWVKVEQSVTEDGAVDQSKYGLSTVEDVQAALTGAKSALVMTHEQARRAVQGEFSDKAGRSVRVAVRLAEQAPEGLRERVYRAALIGAEIEHYTVRLNEGQATQDELEQLQALVSREVATYGNPAHDLAKLVLTSDGASRVTTFAKSVGKDGGFNDLLSGRVERATAQAYRSDDFGDVVRYLVAMSGQPVALEDAQQYYTGAAPVRSLDDAAGFDDVAITATGLLTTMRRYVSGNVVQKSNDLKGHIAAGDETPAVVAKWRAQLDAIEQARPKADVDAITFAFRGKWFPRKYLLEFLQEQGFTDIEYDYKERQWWVEGADGFEKQLGKYINGQGVSAGVRTAEYRDRVTQLEAQFNIWIRQHEDIDDLVKMYNDVFNAHLPHEYDDSDLGLTGVSEQVKPHWYQNAAIRRASDEGRGIMALDVGLGKTFSALALAAYNRQQGRAKRTCIVVPKAVLENWYHEAKQFYGNLDNALFVGFTPERNKDGAIVRKPVLDENGQPKKNRHTGETEYRDALKEDSNSVVFDKMHQIPSTTASLVIMTKERFGEIPMRPETREAYTDKMVDKRLLSETKSKEFFFGAKGPKGSYDQAKKSEKYAELYSKEGSKKKNQFPYFEQMGFDSVIVDEAHEFKNAYEAGGQTSKLAYLPTAPASKRSIDMAAKMAYLRENNAGRGPVLLSATPVTNSPTEIFNMLSYVMDIEELESMGITSVDDFIAHYCDVETVDVVKLSGAVEAKEAVVGFRNLHGLRNLFNRFTNVKKAQDVNDEHNSLKIPDANEQHAVADMTDEQKDIYELLRLQAEGLERDPVTGEIVEVADEDRRPVFAIIRDMDRVTTDIDLYNRTMTFTFAAGDSAKVNQLIADLPENISQTIGSSEDGEAEEVIMAEASDIETRTEGQTLILVAPEGYEQEIVRRFGQFGIEPSTVAHPVTPKYAKMLENLRAEYERGGKQLVFTEEKSQHNKLKRLVVHHLPVEAAEIAIINADTAGGDKLEQISAAYNTGKAKIVIANRKAEVGVNLQRGTTAIHHLTLPWTPASIQQRNGRGVRQGNTASSVDVFYYLGKGSFDQYRLDMLKRKADWLDALFTGTEAKAENANAGVSDEYAAMLASDPEEFKRRILAQKTEKAARERDQRNLRAAIDLHNLAASRRALATIEERRATALRDLATQSIAAKINDVKGKIKDNEQAIKRIAAGGETEIVVQGKQYHARLNIIKSLKKLLADLEAELDSAEGHVDEAEAAAINERYDRMKEKYERKVKSLVAGLTQQQDTGKIDLDAKRLIESGNYVVDTNGTVVEAGAFYQYFRDSVGRAGEKAKQIFEVSRVDLDAKRIFGQMLVGNDYYVENPLKRDGLPINSLPSGLQRVNLSRRQIAQERTLAKGQFSYLDLFRPDGDVGAEWLAEMQGELGLKMVTGTTVVARDSAGNMQLAEVNYRGIPEGLTLVYPDMSNAEFRKWLGTALLPFIEGTPFYTRELAKVAFGEDWKTAIAQYGNTADQSMIRIIASNAAEPLIEQATTEAGDDLGQRVILLEKAVKAAEREAKQVAIAGGYVNTVEIGDAAAALAREALEQANRALDEQEAAEAAARKANMDRMLAEAATDPSKGQALEAARSTWMDVNSFGDRSPEQIEAIQQGQVIIAELVERLMLSGEDAGRILAKASGEGQRSYGDFTMASQVPGNMRAYEFGKQAEIATATALFPDIISPADIQKAVLSHIGDRDYQAVKAVKSVIPDIARELIKVELAADKAALTRAWSKFTLALTALWDDKSFGHGLYQYGDFSRKGPRMKGINAILATCQTGFMARFGKDIQENEAPTATTGIIPESLIKAFADQGIEAKVNTSAVMWAERNKGRQQLAEPGTRLFLFDPEGRSGPLNTMAQGWLKREFDAVWSADFSSDFNGLWWHIPVAGVDFEKLESKVS